jgi:putative transposase
MGRPKKTRPSLPTIWHVPDALWMRVEPSLAEYDPPPRLGRKRIDQRAVLDGVIFRLRTGCQWNHLPRELPDDSSVHRTFQRRVRLGLLERLWAALVEDCQELGGVDGQWQAADTAMGEARLGGTASAPTRPIVPSPA